MLATAPPCLTSVANNWCKVAVSSLQKLFMGSQDFMPQESLNEIYCSGTHSVESHSPPFTVSLPSYSDQTEPYTLINTAPLTAKQLK